MLIHISKIVTCKRRALILGATSQVKTPSRNVL